MATNQESAKELGALRRRRRLRQVLGAAVCVLVVIGLTSVVSGAVRLGAKLFDDSDEKAAYELRLRNLVALDPLPFNSLEELSPSEKNVLLNAAIWSSIGDSDAYEHDEVGAMYLPTLDIDKTVAALYGPDFKFEYQTFEDNGMTFQYVEEKQAYLLPITSAVNTYYPEVERIKREGNTRRVTVGYISLYPTGGEFSINSNFTPTKYLDYIFTKNGDEYYLSAIVESEMTAESTSGGAAPDNIVASASMAPQEVLDSIAESLPAASDAADGAQADSSEANSEGAPAA